MTLAIFELIGASLKRIMIFVVTTARGRKPISFQKVLNGKGKSSYDKFMTAFSNRLLGLVVVMIVCWAIVTGFF
jgi:hypothetical protein